MLPLLHHMSKVLRSAALLLSLSLGFSGLSLDLRAVSDDDRGLTISLNLSLDSLLRQPAQEVYPLSAKGFLHLSLPGGGYTSEPGHPRLPFVTAVVEAPSDMAGVEFVALAYHDLSLDRPLLPASPPFPKLPGFAPEFDHFLPNSLGQVLDISASAGPARGHRLLAVRFNPVHYNPAKNLLRIFPHISARIQFQRVKPEPSRRATTSASWEEFLDRLCLWRPAKPSQAKASDIYLDIFAGHSFMGAAARLAEWKARLGFKVRLWDAGGWTAQAIRDTIRTRQPLATYVLLLSDPNAGGLDSLPASAPAQSGGFPTDLYYAETDDIGYLPDLFVGRLSVRTPAEAEALVDKIIYYQKGDFGTWGTAWLNKALFIAGYDGYFQSLAQSTNRYCYQLLKRRGYTEVDTLVMAQGEEQDRIISKINQGRAWAIYTAHGSPVAWSIGGISQFTADEVVAQVHNQGRPALVSGHCCNSGYFLYNYSDCFGEVWPKLPDRGGVYYFGSVPLTYWDEDDWLQRRYFEAIYDSVPGTPGLYLLEPGRFTQYGLYWIELHTATVRKQYYFEAYHLLGDPSLTIWTAAPQSLSVDHPQLLAPGSRSLSLRVFSSSQPVSEASVCVWSRHFPEQHLTRKTDQNGMAVVMLDTAAIEDTLLLSVTAAGYKPYLSQTLVLSRLHSKASATSIPVGRESAVTLTVTDPDSGGAPVCSLDIYGSYNGGLWQWLGQTDVQGQAQLLLAPDQGGYVALRGRLPGKILADTVQVLAPQQYQVNRIYPNPFSSTASIEFQVPEGGPVEIRIYNILGQKVRTIAVQAAAGFQQVVCWDGRSDDLRDCPSGLYFATVGAPGRNLSSPQRMVFIR